MQIPGASERKANKTRPALATSPESRCNDSVDAMAGWQIIECYDIRRISSHMMTRAKLKFAVRGPLFEAVGAIQVTKRATQDDKHWTILGNGMLIKMPHKCRHVPLILDVFVTTDV